MKSLERSVYVGPSLYAHCPVIRLEVDLGPLEAWPTVRLGEPFIGALLAALPGLAEHTCSYDEAGGFLRSNDDVAYPNLMYHFLPIAVRYDGTLPEGGGPGYQVHVGPMYSDARGTCTIVNGDPRAKPALRFNYLSTDQDRREWVEAIRVTRGILEAPAFAPFSGGEISPGKQVETDEQILDWVAKDAETALHPSCTARMGTDPELSVVNEWGRCHTSRNYSSSTAASRDGGGMNPTSTI